MTWIVDRIEENFAVCELDNGKTIDIPLTALPSDIKEGSVLSISIDNNEINDRKEKIDKLMDSLFVD